MTHRIGTCSAFIGAFCGLFFLSACAEPNDQSSTSEPAVNAAEPLVTYTEDRAACVDRNPSRNAYFGDTHIHTGFSYDARPYGTDITPADAYRFAKGEAIPVPPFDDAGRPTQTLALKRPLDFAAVTDHSEFFGELKLCTDPSSSVYDLEVCQMMRDGGGGGMFPFIRIVISETPERIPEICGDDGAACEDASISLWQLTQNMAEAAYDKSSACSFTSFVGYEHTGTPNSNNYHRNVVFRNANVPERAISYVETPTDRQLWDQLTEQCHDGTPGCDVLVIPHNSNISSGAMFPSYTSGFESNAQARATANMRNAMEPVMEVFQHKGNSECFNGFPNILGDPDELCNIEQYRVAGEHTDIKGDSYEVEICEDGEVGQRGFVGRGCISQNDFYRSVLLTGLQDESVIGVNSYKIGVIASTDTHIGLAGHTDEHDWIGHLVVETELAQRLEDRKTSPQRLTANPGGLAGVWAVENSRDAIFDAFERREAFGTSGTRIQPRLFGGWDFSAKACAMENTPAHGYAKGVAMGSDLKAGPNGVTPQFLVSATRDPDASQLQELQIIKGWVDGDGRSNYKVFDVAGHENHEGEIDLASGEWSGTGSDSLCTVFEDPEFSPDQAAYYYMRAVEVPTLRWSWSQCVALPEEERPDECVNDAPKVTQEMAWSSPIWYLPAN
jgi:hypothetical protein